MNKNNLFSSILCILFIGIVQSSFAQKKYDLNDINLSWVHFTKKDASLNSKVAAQTHVNLDIEYELKNASGKRQELIIKLSVSQSREQSWVSKQFLMKASDIESDKLLNHEKLHYVINLIGFKNIYLEMSNFSFTSDYKSEITSIFRKYTNEIDKMNNEYDRQSKHGLNNNGQKKWEENTMKLFNELYGNDTHIQTQYTIRTYIDM